MSTFPISIAAIPHTEAFTPAQRAWLSGFFTGLFQARGATTAAAPAVVASVEAEEEMPWHDASLAMVERLKLAEGKRPERVMMAAMAQLDCGACGYVCKTYGEAIARGEEKDLTRCAPGGKHTTRKLKELVALHGTSSNPIAPSQVKVKGAQPGRERANPYPARLLQSKSLNAPGSGKDTRLIALDLKGSGLTYHPGDSLGVWPENCPDTVTWILEALDASGAEKVHATDGSSITLKDALLRHYAITKPSAALLELLAACAADAEHVRQIKQFLADDGPGVPDGYEVLDLLMQFPSARPPVQEFVAALSPMQPRLYSISSSLRAHPDEVHLTVGVVRFVNGRSRQCKGVASTYLAERVRPGQKVRIFIQPSHGFRLPASADAPAIMIGPGTGIAPFRAFLQDRKASGSRGGNWLFFGDQRSEFDFLYRRELEQYQREGVLTHLSTAFSRDQERKVYVQHRLLENGADLWTWLRRGAHFYVCGDAKRMALDVDQALRQIIEEHGKMTAAQAKTFVSEMAKTGRYQRDVY